MKHIDQVFKDKLWFWITGGLAIILAGLGYYFTQSADAPLKGPLAEATTTVVESAVIEQPTTETASTEVLAAATQEESMAVTTPQIEKVLVKQSKTIKPRVTTKATTAVSTSQIANYNQVKQVDRAVETVSTSSVTSSVSHADDLMKYGKPANLVITKSYINAEGAIIEKSDLSKDNEVSDPVYNVFINSEGLNAGAMMRVVEPLEKMPLPAFSKDLKKKINL